MCVIVKSAWRPCGHRSQKIERCPLAYPLPESDDDDDDLPRRAAAQAEENLPVCADATTRRCTQRVAVCPVGRHCMPADYWTCCRCQPLLGAGVKGQAGGLRQKRHVRLARFAPSCSARQAAAMLRVGGVCEGPAADADVSLAAIDEVDVEYDADSDASSTDSPISPPSPSTFSPQPSPSSVALAVDMDIDADGVPPIRWDAMEDVVYEADASRLTESLLESTEYSPYMDVDEDYCGSGAPVPAESADQTCRHARCGKCLAWRRCLCGCACRQIIPRTRRRCHLCARSKCRARDPSIIAVRKRGRL